MPRGMIIKPATLNETRHYRASHKRCLKRGMGPEIGHSGLE